MAICLQFTGRQELSQPECCHVFFARAWQACPEELHIQFKPATDNFFITYRLGCFEVKYKNKVLKYDHAEFCSDPLPDSVALSQPELEKFWYSPNRPTKS